MDKSSQPQMPQRPTLLDHLGRIAAALENAIPQGGPQPVQRPRGSGAALLPGLCGEDRATIKSLKADMAEIKVTLSQITELLAAERGEVVKEAYTVEEVSTKTRFKPFTIRQACNKGRIKGAYKGRDHAWRIPHASLLDLLSNGLPPE